MWRLVCCANRSIFGGYVIVENSGMEEYHYFIELTSDGSERWTSIYQESQGILPWSICYIHPGPPGHLLAGSAYSTGPYGGPAFWFGTVNSGPVFFETGYYCYDVEGNTNCIQPTSDSGCIVTGEPWTLMKTSASGDSLWTKTYNGRGYFVTQISDGGYMITGADPPPPEQNPDLWILKTDNTGDTITTGIESSAIGNVSNLSVGSSIGPEIVLKYSNYLQGFYATIYDVSGRMVEEIHNSATTGTITWGEGMSLGVYFILPQGSDTNPVKVILIR
jgi:hypothetical protein